MRTKSVLLITLLAMYSLAGAAQSKDRVIVANDGEEIADLTRPFGTKNSKGQASLTLSDFNNISITLPTQGFLLTDTFDVEVAGANGKAPLWRMGKRSAVAGETITIATKTHMMAKYAKKGSIGPVLADRLVVEVHRYNRKTQTTGDHVCVVNVKQ